MNTHMLEAVPSPLSESHVGARATTCLFWASPRGFSSAPAVSHYVQSGSFDYSIVSSIMQHRVHTTKQAHCGKDEQIHHLCECAIVFNGGGWFVGGCAVGAMA